MAVLIKNITTYQKTKPAYDAYRKAKNKEQYRAAHESSIILHEAAEKALKAAGVAKLPNIAALQTEYAKLQEQKEALYADYGKLKKQIKEYDVIKRNIDSILRREQEPLKVCKNCGMVYFNPHQKSEFCSVKCRNYFNVKVFREKR